MSALPVIPDGRRGLGSTVSTTLYPHFLQTRARFIGGMCRIVSAVSMPLSSSFRGLPRRNCIRNCGPSPPCNVHRTGHLQSSPSIHRSSLTDRTADTAPTDLRRIWLACPRRRPLSMLPVISIFRPHRAARNQTIPFLDTLLCGLSCISCSCK